MYNSKLLFSIVIYDCNCPSALQGKLGQNYIPKSFLVICDTGISLFNNLFSKIVSSFVFFTIYYI